jgi:predicted amidohydrolase YtcJ
MRDPVSERSGTAYGKRVSLAGKTVMPMIVDTHVHLSETRDALIRD